MAFGKIVLRILDLFLEFPLETMKLGW